MFEEVGGATKPVLAVKARDGPSRMNRLMHSQVTQLAERPAALIAHVRWRTILVRTQVPHQRRHRPKLSTARHAGESQRAVNATNVRRHVVLPPEAATALRACAQRRRRDVCRLVSA